MRARWRPAAVVTGVAVTLLAACSGGSSGGTATPPATTAGAAATSTPVPSAELSWTTYHAGNDRTGQVKAVTPHRLSSAWRAKLDGAVYGQPLLVNGLVIAATEGDSVYGLDPASGTVRWQRTIGTPMPLNQLPCGNIDPLGITGTPAYDATTRSVFVVAETTDAHHQLYALDPATGVVRFSRNVDIPGRDRHAEQQRGALAVANGRVYVPFGGLDGDCGNYVGYITAVPATGTGASTTYAVPTAREGGMWAASGIAVGSDGDVWAAVGNGASTDEPYDGSDSVLRLAPDLSRRIDYFAPTSWGSQNADDLDLGTTGPLLVGDDRVLVSGKDGNVYLLAAARLGGIGGQTASVDGCKGFGGLAYDASASAAFVPCTKGLLRVDVGTSTLTKGWRADDDVTGSPVVGAGAVWALDPSGGTLHVLDENTGKDITTAGVGEASRFASPVVAGNLVLVPTLAGVTALTIS